MGIIFTAALLGIAVVISRWTAQYFPGDDLLVNADIETRFFTRIFPFAGKWRAYISPLHEKRMLEYTRRLRWSYLLLSFIVASFVIMNHFNF